MRRLYEWKLMNPQVSNNNSSTGNVTVGSSSAKNFPSQIGNYNKILTAIRTEKVFTYSPDNINRLSDRILDVDLEYKGKRERGLSIVYRPDRPNYVVITYDADDNETSKDVCASFEEVLDALVYEGIIKDKTLCESAEELKEWKYMNPPANNNSTTSGSSSGNFPNQEERYKKLIAQIDKEKKFSYKVLHLNDNALVFELIMDSTRKISIAIVYKPYTNPPVWKVGINNNPPVDYIDWNELLEVFEVPGIIKDISSLKESFSSSIAEEFEAYNNLWK